MYESHIVWADGSGYYNGAKITQYSKKGMETIPEFTNSKTSKVFFFNDCVLFLSKKGEVFQKGNFSFQGEMNKKIIEVKRIDFGYNKKIKKIKIGENHILFLDTEGMVYSIGDNYYGQLGIGNKMIACKSTPCYVTLPTKYPIEEIKVHKNTCFAIDKERQLIAWGQADYIPNYNSNVYSPKLIFQKFRINYLRFDSDRVIIKTTKVDKLDLEQKKAMVIAVEEEEASKAKREEENSNPPEEEKKNLLLAPNKTINFFKQEMKNKVIDVMIENKIIDNTDALLKMKQTGRKKQEFLTKHYEIFGELSDLIEKLLSLVDEKKDDELSQLKEILENQHKLIVTDWEHPEVLKILDFIQKMKKNLPKQFSPKQKEDYEKSLYFSLMSLKYDIFGNSKIEDTIKKIKEEIARIEDVKEPTKNIDEDITNDIERIKKEVEVYSNNKMKTYNKSLIRELYFFINYMVKYKKLEMLIYKMGMHNFILNTYEVDNAKDGLEENFKKSIRSIEKNKIILDKCEMIQHNLIKFIDENFKEIDLFYEQLPSIPKNLTAICNEVDESEKFLYKNIIESTMTIKDLWTETISEFKEENEKREEIQVILDKVRYFKDIFGIQVYLEKVQFEFLLPNEENDKKIYLEKKFKVKDQFNQIDGAISRLLKIKEIVLDKVIQAKNENEDEVGGTAKQMVLMYLSSVLEIAYTKKAIWSLLQLRYYPN